MSCRTRRPRTALAPGRWLALALLQGLLACQDSSPDVAPTPDSAAPSPPQPADNRLADALRPAMQLVADGAHQQAFELAGRYADSPGALRYQAVFLQGYARHKAKRYAAARELFEQAIALAPDYHPSWHFLGFACHALGDLERAGEAFATHARLRPGEGDDAFGLGLVALARDDLDEAERQLERALTLHRQAAAAGQERRRELAKVLARLGDVHAARDDWAAAREVLVQAVRSDAGHEEIWHKLATAHRRLGEDALADQAQQAREQLRAREVDDR